jgi:hypothetical protein
MMMVVVVPMAVIVVVVMRVTRRVPLVCRGDFQGA